MGIKIALSTSPKYSYLPIYILIIAWAIPAGQTPPGLQAFVITAITFLRDFFAFLALPGRIQGKPIQAAGQPSSIATPRTAAGEIITGITDVQPAEPASLFRAPMIRADALAAAI
jgi:hypothetical protein